MELKEQFEFCRKCIKRETNSSEMLVCSLTHERPKMGESCINFVRDNNEPEVRLDDSFTLSFDDIKENLDPTIYKKLKLEQKLPNAIIFGIIAGLIGAIIWAFVSVITGYQIGYMAIGVGALVGFTVRFFGNGFEIQYAFIGAIISLLSCMVGNLLGIIGLVANENNMGYLQIIENLNFSTIFLVMKESFKIMDLIFYGIAIYEGFRFATLKFNEKSLWNYTRKYN